MFSVRITTHAHTVLVLRTAFLAALLVCPLSAQEKRALTFTDLMKIREVEHASISEGGDWVAFTAEPDRGDPEVVVRATAGDARYVIPWASHPVISRAGDFVVARVNVSMAEEADAAPEDPPQRGMAILTTATGEVHGVEDVRAFAISEDGRWLVYHRFLERHEDPAEGRGPAAPAEGDREPGSTLVVRELVTGSETEIAHVRSFGLDEAGRRLAYAAADAEHRRDGLYVRDLRAGTEHIVDARPFGHYTQVTWSEGGSALAFIRAEEDEDGEPGAGSLHVWREAQVTDLVGPGQVPEGWVLPAETNSVTWSENGERLFFGWRPLREDERDRTTPAGGDAGFDAYDVDAILADRGVDVWHWRDPYINPEQKVLWSRVKDRVYTAVYHFDSGRVVSLGDPAVPDVSVPDNADLALARSSVPYRLESTWMGSQSDVWIVDLRTGEKTLVAERLGGSGDASLSPDGRFVAYYQNGHYHLYDVETATKRNLTEDLGVPIANEDHDYPRNPPGYGIAGWIEGDRAVLVHVAVERGRVVGFDLNFIELCIARDAGDARLGYTLGDGYQLPLRDGFFDLVICRHTIEHLYHPLDFLREARRVLRPGGYLYLSTPNLFSNALVTSPDGRKWLRLKLQGTDRGVYQLFSLGSLRRLGEEAGFAALILLPLGSLPQNLLTQPLQYIRPTLKVLLEADGCVT